jgi:glyoxylase I family protein
MVSTGWLHSVSASSTPTVSDVEASAQWYERVFGMNRVPVTFPHYGAEEGGYAVLLMDPRSGIAIGLHHHEANPGQPFQESRTGLDHISVGVADRASLDAWASWLDELGIEHSGVIDTDKPMPYSVLGARLPRSRQHPTRAFPHGRLTARGARPLHGEAEHRPRRPRPSLIPPQCKCECTHMTDRAIREDLWARCVSAG